MGSAVLKSLENPVHLTNTVAHEHETGATIIHTEDEERRMLASIKETSPISRVGSSYDAAKNAEIRLRSMS